MPENPNVRSQIELLREEYDRYTNSLARRGEYVSDQMREEYREREREIRQSATFERESAVLASAISSETERELERMRSMPDPVAHPNIPNYATIESGDLSANVAFNDLYNTAVELAESPPAPSPRSLRRGEQTREELIIDWTSTQSWTNDNEPNFTCFGCGSNLKELNAEDIFTVQDMYNFCPDCVEECDDCGKKVCKVDRYIFDDKIYCMKCVGKFPTCEWCRSPIGGEVFSDEFISVCRQCYEYSCNCTSCGRYVHEDNARYDNDENSLCGSCYSDWRSSQPIKYYDYKPMPAFKQVCKRSVDKLYFGIELEVYNNKNKIADYTKAKYLSDNYNWIYCKEDSSISRGLGGNGFEIVTHPLSYAWLKNNRQTWADILTNLREDGYTSYDPTTCGIHIHMSKKAFTTFHFYKFLKLFYDKDNFGFIYTISQRCQKSTVGECQWGNYNENNAINPRDTIMKAKAKMWHGRYTAVNLENRNTVEIRIFRGTLSFESFYKNIEFLQALYSFTKDTSVKAITVDNFTQYISENRKIYYNLYNFLKGKNICV